MLRIQSNTSFAFLISTRVQTGSGMKGGFLLRTNDLKCDHCEIGSKKRRESMLKRITIRCPLIITVHIILGYMSMGRDEMHRRNLTNTRWLEGITRAIGSLRFAVLPTTLWGFRSKERLPWEVQLNGTSHCSFSHTRITHCWKFNISTC